MKANLRTRSLREVREERLIPGVMYGKSIESTSIEVEEKALKDTLQAYGKSMTFEVTLNGKKHNAYIKHVQTNILKPNEIIHFELHRISKDETISASIPVVIEGKDELQSSRLYVQMGLSEINCEYAPGSGIHEFKFNVAELEQDYVLHVKDIEVPEGVTIQDDPEHVVFAIKEAKQEVEETESEEDVEGEIEVEPETESEA